MTFYVIQCPNCGRIQVQESRKAIKEANFKCKYESCGKSRKFKNKRIFGLNLKVLHKTENPRDASVVCRILKQERNK